MRVEVVRVVKWHDRLRRAIVLVDGGALTYRSDNRRRWKCVPCGIEEQANCLHVVHAARAVRNYPRHLVERRS